MVQGYLAHTKHPPPYDHHRSLGIGLLKGPVSCERRGPVPGCLEVIIEGVKVDTRGLFDKIVHRRPPPRPLQRDVQPLRTTPALTLGNRKSQFHEFTWGIDAESQSLLPLT